LGDGDEVFMEDTTEEQMSAYELSEYKADMAYDSWVEEELTWNCVYLHI
jgi:hypothetical protein